VFVVGLCVPIDGLMRAPLQARGELDSFETRAEAGAWRGRFHTTAGEMLAKIADRRALDCERVFATARADGNPGTALQVRSCG
jgi:hypothetical protein